MSALLAHAKAYRALAEAMAEESDGLMEGHPAKPILLHLSAAHHGAANRLEGQARAEVSPPYVSPIKPVVRV